MDNELLHEYETLSARQVVLDIEAANVRNRRSEIAKTLQNMHGPGPLLINGQSMEIRHDSSGLFSLRRKVVPQPAA